MSEALFIVSSKPFEKDILNAKLKDSWEFFIMFLLPQLSKCGRFNVQFSVSHRKADSLLT